MSDVQEGTLPCNLSHDAINVTCAPPPPREQTDACEVKILSSLKRICGWLQM